MSQIMQLFISIFNFSNLRVDYELHSIHTTKLHSFTIQARSRLCKTFPEFLNQMEEVQDRQENVHLPLQFYLLYVNSYLDISFI